MSLKSRFRNRYFMNSVITVIWKSPISEPLPPQAIVYRELLVDFGVRQARASIHWAILR